MWSSEQNSYVQQITLSYYSLICKTGTFRISMYRYVALTEKFVTVFPKIIFEVKRMFCCTVHQDIICKSHLMTLSTCHSNTLFLFKDWHQTIHTL